MNVTLFRQVVMLKRPIRASLETHDERTRLYLRVEHEGHQGFGEVSPQPRALNGDPGVDDVLDALRGALRRLEDVREREGEIPHWSRVARLGGETPSQNVAYALIEMALLDRELRRDVRRVSDLWVPQGVTPLQQTVSLLDDTTWSLSDEAARLRVKCAPGAVSAFAREQLREVKVPVILDFNCSASNDDEVLEVVAEVREFATVDAVEQPFAVGNVVDHARLAKREEFEVSLDEGVRSLRDLAQIERYGAAAMVCVKPARVGGLANARTIILRAEELGLRVYLGGFFESPYARQVNRALANSCVREPSDLGVVGVSAYEEPATTSTSFGVEPSVVVLAEAERLTVLSQGDS
jgi:O-succinylbenzoate synthase